MNDVQGVLTGGGSSIEGAWSASDKFGDLLIEDHFSLELFS
jgi:hypothetical protein